MRSLNWFGLSCVFSRAPSVGGQDEAFETNSKPSDWTGSEIQRNIWENEVERGLDDCQPPGRSAASVPGARPFTHSKPQLLLTYSGPVLRPPAVLSRWPSEFNELRQVESDFVLDDFTQRDIRGAKAGDVRHQRPAGASAATVQLPDASGNQVDQDVRIRDLLQSFFDQGGIHVAAVPYSISHCAPSESRASAPISR